MRHQRAHNRRKFKVASRKNGGGPRQPTGIGSASICAGCGAATRRKTCPDCGACPGCGKRRERLSARGGRALCGCRR